jgi:AbiV family abortive infection protein
MKPKAEALEESITVTIENGKKLLEDAELLFGWDRFSTALALSVLAQEEFAKAFLLKLVSDDALPWLPEIQRSMTRHQSKHLLGIVMEWIPPIDWDKMTEQIERNREKHQEKMAWFQRRIDRYNHGNFLPDPNDPEPVEPDVTFPTEVAAALNIFRHEEIERFRSGSLRKDPEWAKGKARKIADGTLDHKKQSALYVAITKTGKIGLHPALITRAEALEAIELAKRLSDDLGVFSEEYRKLKETLPQIFMNLKESDDGR